MTTFILVVMEHSDVFIFLVMVYSGVIVGVPSWMLIN